MRWRVCRYEPMWVGDRWAPGRDPVFCEVTLAELERMLTEPVALPRGHDRDQIWSWAPHSLSAPRRKKANVVDVTCLVLDYDDGTSLTDGVAPWQDWHHILHTSRSHTEAAPRFRVVLPLEQAVPADVWPRAWLWAEERSGKAIDPKCKDASRLYYLPVQIGDTMPYEARVHDGPLLDLAPWDELPAIPEPPAPRPRRAPLPGRSRPEAWEVLRTPSGRAAAADYLGAHVDTYDGGRRARRVLCPSCGDRSVWFIIDHYRSPKARCHHLNHCGWVGWLDELLEQT